jgi:hypothetical protein
MIVTVLAALLAGPALTVLPGSATAAPAQHGVFAGHTMDGQPLPCGKRPSGIWACHGNHSGIGGTDLRFRSFDGTPLAVFVTLPATASTGGGDYPLVVQSHGWGEPPGGPDDGQYGGPTAAQWARDGYAVLQFAARGWGNSCGSPVSRLVNVTACLKGYVHLDDYRFEARDVQYAVGVLVDEGIVDPKRIGVTGESYGGGVSLELATLNNRVMDLDGRLRRWRSPKGVPLGIAGAVPFATWSDLIYSLAPNGRTLDSRITSKTADLKPTGVQKTTIASGLYAVGTASAYYAPPFLDPQADVTNWFLTLALGEPYDTARTAAQVRQAAKYHSPYYLLAGAYGFSQVAPAPLLLANGFTDDVFPADEVLRFYNLERKLYPSAPVSLLLADVGHQRADNKFADGKYRVKRIKAFFDHFVKGTGPRPPMGVTAQTQRCTPGKPSGGPYHAATWRKLQRGAVRYRSQSSQTVLSVGGNPLVSKAFDPVIGGLACTTAPSTNQGPGIATYRLPRAKGRGFTLIGAPVVTANLSVTGPFAYLAARLLDVDRKTKTETLVTRGVYRIDPKDPNGRQTFQLHANGWHFAAGHVPVLQLLGEDAPYSRPSNIPFTINVSGLTLKLPTR